jgi:hypothetical protein
LKLQKLQGKFQVSRGIFVVTGHSLVKASKVMTSIQQMSIPSPTFDSTVTKLASLGFNKILERFRCHQRLKEVTKVLVMVDLSPFLI